MVGRGSNFPIEGQVTLTSKEGLDETRFSSYLCQPDSVEQSMGVVTDQGVSKLQSKGKHNMRTLNKKHGESSNGRSFLGISDACTALMHGIAFEDTVHPSKELRTKKVSNNTYEEPVSFEKGELCFIFQCNAIKGFHVKMKAQKPTRQKEVQQLIDEFEDIFPNLPHGLPPDRGKERKYTSLPKCKMIELLLRMVSMRESMQHETQLISLMHSTPTNMRSLACRQRKREHPLRLPTATELSPSANGRKFDDSWVCKNSACRAILSLEDIFCKGCSCCICHQFDDNKDPSLWLVCSLEPPHEGNSCGLSCHLECALKHKKAGVVKIGQLMQLDGGYCCASCGRVNGLTGCWRKELNIAKDAQRVDILCYRISLSQRLLNGTCWFKEQHDIVVKAARKIEEEVGPIDGVPSKMAQGIVSRPSTGFEVQKLCTMAVEKVKVLLCRISPLGTGVHLTAEESLLATCRMQFEDVTSTSLVVLLKEIDLKIIARCSWLQIVALQGQRIDLSQVSHLEDVVFALCVAANCSDVRREPLYIVAATFGGCLTVRSLLTIGMEVKGMKDSGGDTSLFVAVECGYANVCELLLQGGADVLVCNTAGENPLYIAALRGHCAVVEVLVSHCCKNDIIWQNGDGWATLMATTVADRQDIKEATLTGTTVTLLGSTLPPCAEFCRSIIPLVESLKIILKGSNIFGILFSCWMLKIVMVKTTLHIAARRASIWFVCNLLIAGASMDICAGYIMRAIDESLRPKDEKSENDVNDSPSGWPSNKNQSPTLEILRTKQNDLVLSSKLTEANGRSIVTWRCWRVKGKARNTTTYITPIGLGKSNSRRGHCYDSQLLIEECDLDLPFVHIASSLLARWWAAPCVTGFVHPASQVREPGAHFAPDSILEIQSLVSFSFISCNWLGTQQTSFHFLSAIFSISYLSLAWKKSSLQKFVWDLKLLLNDACDFNDPIPIISIKKGVDIIGAS
eukprot:Gb_09246 [translate_table: standard]